MADIQPATAEVSEEKEKERKKEEETTAKI